MKERVSEVTVSMLDNGFVVKVKKKPYGETVKEVVVTDVAGIIQEFIQAVTVNTEIDLKEKEDRDERKNKSDLL